MYATLICEHSTDSSAGTSGVQVLVLVQAQVAVVLVLVIAVAVALLRGSQGNRAARNTSAVFVVGVAPSFFAVTSKRKPAVASGFMAAKTSSRARSARTMNS